MRPAAYIEPSLFEEIFSLPKPEVQYLVRVNPITKTVLPSNFEIFADCFIGGSRNRNRERKLSNGMIRFLASVQKCNPNEVSVRWIMAEWDSVVIRGKEETVKKLLKHEQVISFHQHLRMRSWAIED